MVGIVWRGRGREERVRERGREGGEGGEERMEEVKRRYKDNIWA